MSANRYQPHILVLPEDDANSQIANGFLLGLEERVLRRIQIVEPAGGWIEVLNRFASDHAVAMSQYPDRLLVLLMDFEGDQGRIDYVKARIPETLLDRVFVVGAATEPEGLRREGLGSYETIGRDLATDCSNDAEEIWGHELLRHNSTELARMRAQVRPILFG